MSLTGNRDVDLNILSRLDDRSLLNTCLIENRYIYNLCHNELFWKNRYINKWGLEASKYKPMERTWRNHYMKTLIILDEYSDNPLSFLNKIYWSIQRSFEGSYYMKNKKLIPFIEAPEEIMIPFWLLDLGQDLARINRLPYPTSKWTPYLFLTTISEDYIYMGDVYIYGVIAGTPLIIGLN
jgi:hypothetical protein